MMSQLLKAGLIREGHNEIEALLCSGHIKSPSILHEMHMGDGRDARVMREEAGNPFSTPLSREQHRQRLLCINCGRICSFEPGNYCCDYPSN